MTRNDQRERHRGLLAVWVAILAILLPVAYVLSVGPVVWLRQSGYVAPATCELVEMPYWPLAWLADDCKPIRDGLDWYIDLWHG